MKFPDFPRSGGSLMQDMINFMRWARSTRVVSINGVSGRESPNGTNFVLPLPTETGGGKGGDKRFKLSFDAENQKIKVAPGFVVGKPRDLSPDEVEADRNDAYILEPREPLVNGVKISKSDGLPLDTISTGKTYGVYCIANDSVANIRIKEKAEYYPSDGQTAFLIGTFKLKLDGGEKVLDGKIRQLWLSDIPLIGEGVQGDSDSDANSQESIDDSFGSDEFNSSTDLSVIDDSASSDSEDSEDYGDCTGVWAVLDLDPSTLKSCYAFKKKGFSDTICTQVLPMRLRTEIALKNDLAVCGRWRAKVTVENAKPTGSLGAYDVEGDSLYLDLPMGKQVRRFDFLFDPTTPCAIHNWTVEIRSYAQPPPGELDPPGKSRCCGKHYIARSGPAEEDPKPLKLPKRCGSSSCSTDI